MSEWVLSVMGIICLGILLEIVMPEGQTAKYVKGAFSLLVVFVIAAPLPKLLKKDFEFDFGGFDYSVDEEYIGAAAEERGRALARSIEEYLADSGREAEVEAEMSEENVFEVMSVTVSLKSAEADEGAVRESIAKRFKIDRDKISVVCGVTGRCVWT